MKMKKLKIPEKEVIASYLWIFIMFIYLLMCVGYVKGAGHYGRIWIVVLAEIIYIAVNHYVIGDRVRKELMVTLEIMLVYASAIGLIYLKFRG